MFIEGTRVKIITSENGIRDNVGLTGTVAHRAEDTDRYIIRMDDNGMFGTYYGHQLDAVETFEDTNLVLKARMKIDEIDRQLHELDDRKLDLQITRAIMESFIVNHHRA